MHRAGRSYPVLYCAVQQRAIGATHRQAVTAQEHMHQATRYPLLCIKDSEPF